MSRRIGNMITNSGLGIELIETLNANNTTLTFTDSFITDNSTISIYTNRYGCGPSNVSVEDGKITMTFIPSSEDLLVKVEVK